MLVLVLSFSTIVKADNEKPKSEIADKQNASELRSALNTLVDIHGVELHPFSTKAIRAAVLIFVLQDCPISNSYAQEYNRLFDEYSEKGIALYLIHPDPQTSNEEAARHAKEYELKAPVILDHQHTLVKATGVKVTPEAAVINAKGEIVYRGRIDNRYLALGKRSERVSSTELRDALDAIVEDRAILNSGVAAVGCNIGDLE